MEQTWSSNDSNESRKRDTILYFVFFNLDIVMRPITSETSFPGWFT